MDLKSGYPYWAVKNGLMLQVPRLTEAHDTDVVVIGAGITGALVCDALQRDGWRVTVLDRRDVGWGSTSASTALIQYEIDTHLTELAELFGEDQAVLAYRACAQAVATVGEIATRVGEDVDYSPQSSLYYASTRADVDELRAEFDLRKRHGFDVRLLGSSELASRFGVRAPMAIWSALGARLDPYRLASKLLARCMAGGARVFDRTKVEALSPTANGVVLQVAGGIRVNARHVVVAAGYEAQSWLKEKAANNRSSYAFITDPLDERTLGVLRETMVWESARPYLYLRGTGDGRVLVGGEDDAVDIPIKRDASVENKAQRLIDKVKAVMPQLDLEPAFAWAGTFGETEDGLPFFGAHEEWGPNVKFAMAYGGNGITYSVIGAQILAASLQGRGHPLRELFSFERTKSRKQRRLADGVRGLWQRARARWA